MVFDLDHTLVQANMSYAFGKYLYFQGQMGFIPTMKAAYAYARHKIFRKSLKWLHENVFDAFLKSCHKPTLLTHVHTFLDRDFEALIYHPAMDCLNEAKKNGFDVAIFSSSPDFIVEEIAKRLGLDSWIGTSYTVDKEDRLCEILRIVDGDYKALFLRRLMQARGLVREDVTVYSDSILDLPLFELAGTKVAVNPDRRLANYNWKRI